MFFRLACTLIACAFVSIAQDARGTLLGRVTDAQGASLPGVAVKVVNNATQVAVSPTTNAEGNFVAPYLLPGLYTVTVEMTGFKKFVQNDVQLRVNDQVELNVQLQVGDVLETIEVTAQTPLLSTAEASLGQVVDERRITDLPSFAGNPMDLVHLAPGTVNGTNLRLRKAPFNNAPSQFSTDGGGNYQNEFSIDGVANTYSDGTQPRVAFSPPQFALNEFKIQTTAYDASMGHTMGSVVNVSSKGGTNELHGEVHWWFRNKAFDAPTIFQNRSGQSLAQYTDNRYGGSVGGPVVIPKLYNGRNKTFWFFGYEGNKFQDPANQSVSTVPIDAVRNGDLSAYLALGANYQVYDPATTVQNAAGQFVRQPFAGNIIPQNRISPVARAIMNAWPRPNQPTTNREFRNNYFRSSKALEDYWTTIGRVDHAWSEKHRMFLRLHRDYWQEDKNRFLDANDNITGIILNRVNRGIALDDVFVFTPTFLLNVRYGVTAQEFPEQRVSRGFDLSTLGFSPNLVGLIPREMATFPRVNVPPFTILSNWETGDGTTSSLLHHLSGNLTNLKGAHTMRYGVDFRVYREFRNRFQEAVSPNLVFDSTYTRQSNVSANPQLAGEIASFLLGIPGITPANPSLPANSPGNLSAMQRAASYAEQDKYWGFYFQDDWKVSRKLTINLGLRYEYETPITERFDRAVVGFAFDQSNPIEAEARAAYARNPIPELPVSSFRTTGGLTFANTNGNGRGYWNAPTKNFQPRIGIAYQLTPKTIIRTGYGIFTGSIGVNYANTIQTGFSQSTPIQPSLDNGLTFVASLANPFPNGLIEPAGAGNGLRTNLGQNIEFWDPNRRNPYAQRWSFGVQRELPKQILIEMSYVGNRITRLPIARNLNALPNQYLSTSRERDQARITFLNQTVANPFQGLDSVSGATITRRQLLRPYPHFADVIRQENIGYSWYHALQTRIERRFAQGFTFQLSHTWSKAMEAREFLNPADITPSEVISELDRTHTWRASAIWELPFGRGRRFGANMARFVEFFAGGWQLNGIWQNQSGQPLAFGNRIFNGDLSQVSLPSDERSVDRWLRIDPATGRAYGFNTSAAQQLDTNSQLRTFPLRFSGIRGPGQDRLDLSLFKNFRMTERITTQFRAEAYNALNHPNLGNPNADPTNAAYGTITSQDSPRSWQFALRVSF
ncbi:MAG TPA: TonB-dependent receptor [Bryobacteraceae bacterium]|nr:TonB-dependent receptor [Bryobacteraceae bacterium]